jgi:hypothetical protein
MRYYVRKESTTYEVWKAIRSEHKDSLGAFATYSAPGGDECNPHTGTMYTEYGFHGSDFPIIAAETTWNIKRTEHGEVRENEKHEYWLCIGVKEEET